MPQAEQPTVRPPPWWRHGHVWLVIAGPAVVVVASIVTAVIASRGADKVVEEDAWRKGLAISSQPAAERARMPALQGRNHVVTPTAAQR